ncbi:MAG TPA: hypothetical protein EYP14_19775, partial [Planctomycetaceae bacterium]|nr:hypothetical protein [Planctomycetaceae bacterium]
MDVILRGYSVNEPTWFYLSTLLIVAVFFRFGRFWSVRNLDLLLLLAISPGLLLVKYAGWDSLGYAWLFSCTGLLLVRLCCDPFFRRRPRLEQNLNAAGLTFLGVAAFAFLMTKVLMERPPESTVETVRRAEQLLKREDVSADRSQPKPRASEEEAQPGPAAPLLATPVVPPSKLVASGSESPADSERKFEEIAARSIAVLAHFAVVLGLIVFAAGHIGDVQIGLAMATLYLLLPGTAYDVGKVIHVLPTALIVWALVAYRWPMVAGALMGLACGSLFYPIFLLPLWATFYGRRGAVRFILALLMVAAILAASLVLTSVNTHSFTRQMIGSIDWRALQFQGSEVRGFWSTHDANYRVPVVAAFLVMWIFLTIWPRHKTVEHLLAHSTAIVVGIQLWYPLQGGVYLLWYLPMLLMVIFRPRLAHLLPPGRESDVEKVQRAPSINGSALQPAPTIRSQ